MTAALPDIGPESPNDAPAVDALIDRAFGPGRYAKAAERLREGNRRFRDLSLVARTAGAIVGCVRMWPIRIGQTPAVLLGPFAVEEAWRSLGLGAALIRRACEDAKAAGHDVVLLVGDEPYYGPLGFCPAPAGVLLPGPVDPARVLLQALSPRAAEDLGGAVTPDPDRARTCG
ncbi:MAG TPA: N-acetyltransferase [Caulobacteraceae bacterium]|nr:N-acetyltransferase [Caulobacteraceae bacterium]